VDAENSSTLVNPTTTEASGSTPAPKNRHPQPAGLKYRNIPFGAVNPNTSHLVGGPGKDAGKDTMVAPNAIGQQSAAAEVVVETSSVVVTPSGKNSEKKKDKKRKSTAGKGIDVVEDPAVAEKREKDKDKERKRKVESSGGSKSKRMKTE
jgi:hypothetical protein